MARPAKVTKYRKDYEGKKLDKHINKTLNAVELSNLYNDFISTARKERKARLLNNSDIIKQLGKFMDLIENKVTLYTDILEIISYKELYFKIKDELYRLEKKGNGGIAASSTRKENANRIKYSEWIELPIHGFSINFMYSVGKNGKMVRSEAYSTWRNKFPHQLVPPSSILLEQGVDVSSDIGIECQFIAKDKFDVDNFSKSLIDAIWENYGDDDNNVLETKCTRIGTCEAYSDGLIRFRLYNI